MRQYNILHDSFFGNLLFNSILGNTRNKFKTGLNEPGHMKSWSITAILNEQIVVGAFFEYTFDSLAAWNIVAGLRLITTTISVLFSPRVCMYAIHLGKSCFAFLYGTGRKAANIFAENQSLFATNRSIDLRQWRKYLGLPRESVNAAKFPKVSVCSTSRAIYPRLLPHAVSRPSGGRLGNARFIRFYNLEGKALRTVSSFGGYPD